MRNALDKDYYNRGFKFGNNPVNGYIAQTMCNMPSQELQASALTTVLESNKKREPARVFYYA